MVIRREDVTNQEVLPGFADGELKVFSGGLSESTNLEGMHEQAAIGKALKAKIR